MRGSVRPAKDKQGNVIKGAYDVIYDLPPDPTTHKRQQKWKRIYGTRRQADAYLNERIQEIEGGTYREPSKISFGEYATQWLDDLSGLKNSTDESYERTVKKHLIPAMGHIRLRAVDAEALKNYKRFALTEGKRDRKGKLTGEGLSDTSVNNHFRILNLILKSAHREHLIPRNPVQDIDPPPKNKNPKRSFLAVEQARKLLDTAKEQRSRYYTLYLAALTTGMRSAELLGWRWSDINLSKRTVIVYQTLEKSGRHPVFGVTKSKARWQIVLVPELAVALAAWREVQEEEQRLLGEKYRDYGLVFTVPGGAART